MTALVVFALAGAGTYLSRSLFILAVGNRRLPDNIERALRNIGPAVLAALTASLLTTDGLAEFLTTTPEVAAVVVGIVVGAWRRSFAWSFLSATAVWGLLLFLL